MARRSSQVAGWLREQRVRKGDRILLFLGNTVPLWEIMLAAAKIGAVVIPASTLLRPADLADRIERGHVSVVVSASADTGLFAHIPGGWTKIAVGEPVAGLAALLGHRDLAGALRAGRAGPRSRPAAALLHLGHDRAGQAGRAHPHQLPGRAPVHDVLDRPAAGRRAPQRLLAGLGQARLELLVRALERRRHRARARHRPVQRGVAAGHAGPVRGDHAVRAADGLADARAAGPDRPGTCRCGSWSAPASRSTPRSSSTSGGSGG